MRSFLLMVCVTAFPALAGANSAQPRDLAIEVDTANATSTGNSGPAILYINGCFDGGCRVSPGADNSMANTSSLIKGSAQLPAYSYGKAHFDQVVDCVREMYEPFGITVVDTDPGTIPHYETIVSGFPTTLGFPAEIGGIAPFSCDTVPNAVSFVFPGKLGGDVRSICETVAHESAHPWGLEHTYMCEDTMTYLTGCGAKDFADYEAPCGESSARACRCGGTTQNSYRKLVERFGAAHATPPSVSMLSPAPGAHVEQGFAVEAEASDNVAIRMVELWIDGARVETAEAPPYRFTAPQLGNGPHLVEIRAFDDVLSSSTARAEILLGEPCASDSDCRGDQVCAGEVCVAGPNVAGGLGTSCDYNDDCESQMCIDTDFNDRHCVLTCGPGGVTCPSGFACESVGSVPVCVLSDGGGCRAGGSSRVGGWALMVLGLALAIRRRRR